MHHGPRDVSKHVHLLPGPQCIMDHVTKLSSFDSDDFELKLPVLRHMAVTEADVSPEQTTFPALPNMAGSPFKYSHPHPHDQRSFQNQAFSSVSVFTTLTSGNSDSPATDCDDVHLFHHHGHQPHPGASPVQSPGRTIQSPSQNIQLQNNSPVTFNTVLQLKVKDTPDQIKAVKFQSFSDPPTVQGQQTTPSPQHQTSRHSILKNNVSPSKAQTNGHGQHTGSDVVNTDQAPGHKKRKRKAKSLTTSVIKAGSDQDRSSPPVTVRSGLCGCSNLSTERGRRNHALLIMLVSVVPVVALLIQNGVDVFDHSAELSEHNTIRDEILFSVETGNVVHQTQIERGTTALYVSSKGDSTVLANLNLAYLATDKAILGLSRWVVEPDIPHFQSVQAYHSSIKEFRKMVLLNKVPNVTVPEVIKFYSDDNNVILKWVGQFIQHSKSGDLWKTLIGYYMLILSKEQAGAERALGSTFYALGGYNNQQMLAYLERKILGMSYLERCTEFSSNIKLYLSNTFLGKPTDLYLTRMREEILRNSINGSDVTMGSMWFKNMTVYINILKAAQDSLATDVVQGLQREVTSLNSALVESVSVMIVALILFPLVIIAVYRLTHRIQAYAQTLQERTRDLDVERKRSETLLFELLPVSVAQKLLNHEDVPPVSYSAVTIFFSDIVGFTNICSRSTPMQVIDMLNLLYRMFDDILDIYDVYKVETIGDAYMVASGLPQENKERHATEMAEMALDLRDNLSQMTVQHLPGESLRMRIGLNSGPVVAGVVGHKMPRYCLFGDTVNVASRMESTSLPLKIQITDRTRRELERRGGYVITERGKVEIKGKGEMVTYWLDQRLQVSDHVMSDHEGEEDEAGA